MARRCDNCRRPVLESDTVCWHCGWKLSPSTEPPLDQIPSPVSQQKEKENPLDPTSLPLTAFYGGLTLVIIIFLLFLMHSMARNPTLVELGLETADFVRLQDPQQKYSISIPSNWQWYFQENGSVDFKPDRLVEDGEWIAQSGAPLGTLIQDNEQLLIAGNGSVLLLITASEQLNQLSIEQVVSALDQDSFDDLVVEDVRQARNTAGDSVALFNVEQSQPPIHCRHLWTPGETEAYQVTACTTPAVSSIYQNEIDTALDSFQTGTR